MKNDKNSFYDLINQNQKFLIVVSDLSNQETLFAGLAFYNFLLNYRKNTDFLTNKKLSNLHSFLPNFDKIKKEITTQNSSTITIKINPQKITNLFLEKKDNSLNITIESINQGIKKENLILENQNNLYDILIILGSQKITDFGNLSNKYANLFHNIPILNIDNHLNNEMFGELNIVEPKKSSISEILATLFIKDKKLNKFINENTANCLYAGIFEATDNLQSFKTTPETFKIMAKLIENKADHKKIVKNFYKNHNLKTLKVLGEIMSKVEYNQEIKLIHTELTWKSVQKNNLTQDDIYFLFQKIKKNLNKDCLLTLLYQEKENSTNGFIEGNNKEFLRKLIKGIDYNQAIFFNNEKNIEATKKELFELLKKYSQI